MLISLIIHVCRVCTTENLSYLTGSCECNSIGLGVPPGPKANKKQY